MQGVDVGCLLIDPHGNRMMIACHLECECTNNDAKYEVLIQGLRKEVDLKVKV
jgi:ribonuclease HI